MKGLTDEERRRLLNAAKKIHAHKIVQIKGYRTLVKRAKDERIKQLLIRISDDEAKHAEFWSKRIGELGGEREGATRAYLRDRKVGLLMSILGTKGFFEWVVVGEDEGIQDLARARKSELEVWEKESQRKKVKKGRTPEEEREELIRFYQAEGFKRGEAEAIVNRIAEEKELPTQAGTLEELGLAPEELVNPAKAGILCGVSFGLAALVPILPFAFQALSCTDALTASIVATVATLFGVGAMKTIFSRKGWVRSGLEMMVIGASAAAITYMIGTLFSLIV